MAVLFDTLLHPNADFGYEFPPVLQWRRDKQQHIAHLVLGKATPGGAWHVSYKVLFFSYLILYLSFKTKSAIIFNPSFSLSGNGRLYAHYQPWHLDGTSWSQLQRPDQWETQVKRGRT